MAAAKHGCDDLGLLKVGPESAGADPGPACYGRGGTKPAVTDADLELGFLDAEFFLGGDMALDVAATAAALGSVATTLGVSAAETAGGIHELVNQNMAAASRMHAVEMGVDLRGVTMIAFGGAGPVHACGVAELLESPAIIFPVNASVLSAFGTLVTPVRIDLGRSMVRPMATVSATSATPCSTSFARRVAACSPLPVSRTAASGSATASMRATSARATRSRSGSARAITGRSATPRSCSGSRRSTAGSTA